MNSLYICRTCFNPDIFIQTDDDDLFFALHHMYRPFIKERYELNSHVLKLSVYEENAQVYFQNDNVTLKITKELSLQVIENAIYENTLVDNNYIALHAAVVARDNKAYIFAGQTQAGKTTLCSYLESNGYEYLSDDIVLINKSSLKITPYLNPVHLRIYSIGILQKHGIDTSDLIEIKYGNIHRYIKYPKDKTKFYEYDINGIFLIERSISINDIRMLPPYLAFQKILESQINPNIHKSLFEVIKKIIEIDVYKVRYSNMSYIEKLLVPNI